MFPFFRHCSIYLLWSSASIHSNTILTVACSIFLDCKVLPARPNLHKVMSGIYRVHSMAVHSVYNAMSRYDRVKSTLSIYRGQVNSRRLSAGRLLGSAVHNMPKGTSTDARSLREQDPSCLHDVRVKLFPRHTDSQTLVNAPKNTT